MCGICGILRPSGEVDPAALRRMVEALSHRGPDGSGIWLGSGARREASGVSKGVPKALRPSHGSPLTPHGTVGLGHTRLAVIDLSPAGHQPMW